MSLFDDDRPARKIAHEIGSDLSLLSVDELSARIDLMRAEIERLESEKARKGAPADRPRKTCSGRCVGPPQPCRKGTDTSKPAIELTGH